tara:strand:- start:131 stop:1558 length:1428 start_codon:yes stop_codon:yes gene_type:complete
MKFETKCSIIKYYKNNCIYIENNTNIISHIFKVLLTQYSNRRCYIIKNFQSGIEDKNDKKYQKEIEKLANDSYEIIRIIMFDEFIIQEFAEILFSTNHLVGMLDRILSGSYLKKLTINNPFNCSLIYGGFNEIKYKDDLNLSITCGFINNEKIYYKIVKKINTELKYSPLFDIVNIKNNKYIIEFKLVNILILDSIEDVPKIIDETLFMFMKKYKYIDDIVENYKSQNIIGEIQITKKPFYNNFIFESLTNRFDMEKFIKTKPEKIYKKEQTTTNLSLSFTPYTYNQYDYILEDRFKYYYVYEKCINLTNKIPKILNDDEIVNLFQPKQKNKRQMKKQMKKQMKEQEEEQEEEQVEEVEKEQEEEVVEEEVVKEVEEEQEEINFIYINDKYKCLISELLIKELIYENLFFKQLYNKYNNILIFKSICKTYTIDRYINFKFVYNLNNKTDVSKSFHAYLDTKNNITNITYIENIQL